MRLLYFISLLVFVSCQGNHENKTINTEQVSNPTDKKVQKIKKDTFETYLVYKDSLEIYKSPNSEESIFFRFEDDPNYDFGGSLVFDSCFNGWFQIKNNIYYSNSEFKWVKSDNIEVTTTNYKQGSIIEIFRDPLLTSEVIDTIKSETKLNPNMFKNNWIMIDYQNNKGWIKSEDYCTNSTTNCN